MSGDPFATEPVVTSVPAMFAFLKKLFGGKPSSPSSPPPVDASPDASPDASEPSDEETVGHYVDFATMLLPTYIRHGHGFLVLRDLTVDSLLVDGVEVGDPKSTSHPFFTGAFRGYFNVPPGHHAVEARRGSETSTWEVDVSPNQAHVKRIDWSAGGWVDDDAATEKQYIDLARSGSMLTSKALRPWPLTSIYVCSAPDDLMLNGVTVKGPPKFYGIVNLKPGMFVIEAGASRVQFELPPECMQIVNFSSGKPDLIAPRMADPMLRIYLGRAPKEALLRAESIGQPPSGEPGFGDSDLAAFEAAYEQYAAAPGEGTLSRYVEVVRRHYIIDSEMAKQADFFCKYADAMIRHVRASPALKSGPLRTYLDYLAADMQDTGVDEAARRGQELGALLGKG